MERANAKLVLIPSSTDLQFGDDEFNFVKTRAKHGTKQAIELCKDHFEVPEP